MSDSTAQGGSEETWFGHPRSLFVLFMAEMWERFGYYGMRALLIIYLVSHFVFDDRVAGGLYGAFTSLVYLTPLIGGLLADKYLGSKHSVKLGAIFMAAGYFLLAFGGEPAKSYLEYEGDRYYIEVVEDQGDVDGQYVVTDAGKYRIQGTSTGDVNLIGSDGSILPETMPAGSYDFDGERDDFYVQVMLLALAMIIVGNGLFKPNISTIVGALYADGDPRKDVGFTIFYMGINVGSLLSLLIAPWVAETWGYEYGFVLVAIGMCLSFVRFHFDQGLLNDFGNPPDGASKKKDMIIYAGAILSVPVFWFLINGAMVAAGAAHDAGTQGIIDYFMAQPPLGKTMILVFLGAIIGIPIYSAVTFPAVDRDKMIVAVVLTFFSTIFWTLFEQAGSSMTLFADRNTDLNVLGYEMQAGQTQFFNPLIIVLLAPVFSMAWTWLAHRGWEPSTPVKFALGLFQVGLGFLVLVFGAQFADDMFQVGLIWLVLAYILHSTGELCLSPVGLSMITKLSVKKLVGMMMGVWFLSSAMAQYAGGIVAQFASTETVGGQVLDAELSLNTYLGVFETIGIAAMLIGVFLLVISPLLKKGMHGIN